MFLKKLIKAPTRTTSPVTCEFPGHAHCKKIVHQTADGPVLDSIVHYVNGCRHIENFRI